MALTFDVPNFFVKLGTVIGICLNGSAGILFYEIYKGQKTIEAVPEAYIISNIVCNVINLAFGKCKEEGRGDTNMMISSGVGSGLAILWSIFYLYYATKKNGGLKQLLLFIFIDLNLSFELFYIFSYVSTNEIVPGNIALVLTVINAGTPGQNIYKVIKNKDKKLIPIWTTIFGALCNLSWLIYGAFGVANAPDMLMVIPNGLGLLLNILSSGAYWYASCAGPKQTDEAPPLPSNVDDEKLIADTPDTTQTPTVETQQ